MSKEEILKGLEYSHREVIDYSHDNVINAMDIWAKQEAVDFAIFCAKNVLGVFPINIEESEWRYQDKTGRYNKNTNELYELYLQSKQQ